MGVFASSLRLDGVSASSHRLDGVNPLPLLDWELLEDSVPTSSTPVAPHPTQDLALRVCQMERLLLVSFLMPEACMRWSKRGIDT